MERVGREAELATVSRMLSDVRGGAGRALGVLGEPGIGKSALLAAIGARAGSLLARAWARVPGR
jgi:predicted ATPase